MSRALLEQAEGRDQPLEVLVGLDVPRVEDEAAADLVALAHALHLFLARVLQDGLVDRVGDDLDAVGVGRRVEGQDVAAGRLGHGEHEVAAADRAAHHLPRVARGEPVRQVLGEQQVDAVVDGDHGALPAEQGQHVVRRVQEVGAQAVDLERDREVLLHAVARRAVDDGDEVLGEVPERRLVGAVTEEEVRRLPVDLREMADQVPHVGPDAVIPPFAGVDRDLH